MQKQKSIWLNTLKKGLLGSSSPSYIRDKLSRFIFYFSKLQISESLIPQPIPDYLLLYL